MAEEGSKVRDEGRKENVAILWRSRRSKIEMAEDTVKNLPTPRMLNDPESI